MKFIKPKQITDTEFTSSTIAEPDTGVGEAAWASGTTYADGDQVISTSTHRVYESVQGSNIGHDPTTDDGTWWIDIAPTNRWAMFDETVGTISENGTSIEVVFAAGTIINSMALLDLTATSVRVQMHDGATSIYDQTFTLYDQADIGDWYEYFFEDTQKQTALIVTGLPAYATADTTVTITDTTTAKCGTISIGQMVEIGDTQYGARTGIIDYSKKETDIFGVTSVLERTYAKKIDANVFCLNNRLDYFTKKLASVRATACVWIANNENTNFEALIVFGFYKDWQTIISYPNHSICNISIEGLT